MKKLLIILSVMFTLLQLSIYSQIIHVPSDQPTIQAGIDTALDGDTVLVAEDTYYENINFKGKAITVASHFLIDGDTSHISATIIDGSQPSNSDSGSVVTLNSGEDTTSVLCGFTITGGTGTFIPANNQTPPFNLRVGGGIFIDNNSGARIKHNIIENNQITTNYYAGGGGIRAGSATDNSFIIIEDNIIRNNDISGEISFTSGGGISMSVDGRIENNIIENNISRSVNGDVVGGGVRLWILNTSLDTVVCHVRKNIIRKNKSISTHGSAHAGGFNSSGIAIIMVGNTLAFNTVESGVESWGAAMHIGNLNFGISKVEQNYFKGNYGIGSGTFYAGALYIAFSHPLIQNNIFEDNAATLGGAIFMNANEKSYLISNTIVRNSASSAGGGIYSRNSQLVILNSILWGNTAVLSGNQFYREGGTEDIYYCDIEGINPDNHGNINYNPIFADSLFHLSDSSRCIGRGIASFEIAGGQYNAPEYDFEGNIRPNPAESNPDIGAIESVRAYPLLPYIQIPDDYLTIQEGIDAAVNGDTVLVAEGIYYENINFVGKAITVASNFLLDQDTSHISATIINGSQPSHPDSGSVVYFISGEDTTSVLCGFTITGGTGTFVNGTVMEGGGILIRFAAARICNNIIENNTAISTIERSFGGGICALPNFTIIENNIIRNNFVGSNNGNAWGGGIYLQASGRIAGNLITNNESSYTGASSNFFSNGGGVSCNNPNTFNIVEITDNTISENNLSSTTSAGGGGLDLIRTNTVFSGNIVSNNIANGNIFGCGMRVLFGDSNTIINDNIFSFNKQGAGVISGIGGGLLLVQTNGSSVNDNSFTSNECNTGGGVYLMETVSVRMEGNTIEKNESYVGGGVLEDYCIKTKIKFNKILQNSASIMGGGIASIISNNSLIAENTISENHASSGGGILLGSSHSAVAKNLIIGNSADTFGGGIEVSFIPVKNNLDQYSNLASFNYKGGTVNNSESVKFNDHKLRVLPYSDLDSRSVIVNNTIYGNTAVNGGGGISNGLDSTKIMNSILWGNTAATGNDIYNQAAIIDVSYCDIEDSIWSGQGNMSDVPIFVDTLLYYLAASSPCIDAGNPGLAYRDSNGTRNDMGRYGGLTNSIYLLVTNIDDDKVVEIPSGFSLYHNYPNPFNPSTTIKYSIPSFTHRFIPSQEGKERSDRGVLVTLKIYDILGREVAVLVNEKQKPSSYKVVWDASDFSSGVYFYQLVTKDFQQTKKLVLIK